MTTKSLRLDQGQIEVVDVKVADILKKMSGPERLKMVWDAWIFFERRIRLFLKAAHPDWSEEMIQKEISRRIIHGSK